MFRWLSVELPEFAIERALLGAPDATSECVGLVVAEREREVVFACSREARRAGVAPGMTAVAARALCSRLDLRPHDPKADHARLEHLGNILMAFTPDVVIEAPSGLALEIGRTARLFGGERATLEAVEKHLRELGHRAQLGLAPTIRAARTLARAARKAPKVAEGSDSGAALRPLPWQSLEPPRALADLALALGFTTIGEILDLPRGGLATRAGDEALREIEILLGERDDPRARLQPAEHFDQRLELWHPSAEASQILFAAKRLFDLAESVLVPKQQGLPEALLTLIFSECPEPMDLLLCPPLPTDSSHRLTRLLQHRLESLQWPSPVLEVRLRFEHTVPLREQQLGLFEERAPGLGGLLGRSGLGATQHTVLDFVGRVQARLGPPSVVAATLVDDHRPERSFRWHEPLREADAAASRSPGGLRPLEVHETPEPLAVSADATGRPLAILEGFEQGPLRVIRGPERIESGWWDGGDVRRLYFEVETRIGNRLWLFRDQSNGAWRCHGAFS